MKASICKLMVFLGFGLSLCAAEGGANQKILMEISALRLDCSRTSDDEVRQAVQAASNLLVQRCDVSLRLKSLQELPSQPAWCSLPWALHPRQALEEAMLKPLRMAHPQSLKLLIVPGTQDQRFSWAEADPKAPTSPAWQPKGGLAPWGSLVMTDLAFGAMDSHDADERNAHRPWRSVLLAHEAFHAATNTQHPTHKPAGNLMADGLPNLGDALDPGQCACLRASPFAMGMGK